jgi:glycine hydroxymethyltransferase
MSAEIFYGPDFNLLSKQDPDIAAVLLSELKRQQTNLQLIASENFTSRAVLAAMGSTQIRRGLFGQTILRRMRRS